jgi:hypothetical protein
MPAQQQATPSRTPATPAPALATPASAPDASAAMASPAAAQGVAGGGNALANAVASASSPAPSGDPAWSKPELMPIQTELKRLGLYSKAIDGIMGNGSRSGLVEAFASESWRTMSAADVLTKLKAAKTPENAGAKKFQYGEMFKDGVLDITLGIGFDEGGAHLDALAAFEGVLGSRGFTVNAGLAASLFAQAGRSVGPADFGMFFCKTAALTYTPPAGPPRPIHAVVRLLCNQTGEDGGAAAGAFNDGMANSDVAYYSGHGRYGSGPDFDRNMTFELKDARGNVAQTIDDYEVLEHQLATEGKAAGRSAWAQFEFRTKNNTLNVIGANDGNVFLNAENLHTNEFGGKLMYWNLQRQGSGAPLQTGKTGDLGKANAKSPDHKYNIMVFDGCRTKDYVKSVRSTPGAEAGTNDILATGRTLNWGDEASTLGTFLDGIIAAQSPATVIGEMDKKQSPSGAGQGWGNAYAGY